MLTESAERAALYRSLRTHGEGTTRYEVLRTGMNGRLDTLQAAVLLAKLDVFDAELAARARIAAIYDAALAEYVAIAGAGGRTAPAPGRSMPFCCPMPLLATGCRRICACRAYRQRSTTPARCITSPPTRRTIVAARCR